MRLVKPQQLFVHEILKLRIENQNVFIENFAFPIKSSFQKRSFVFPFALEKRQGPFLMRKIILPVTFIYDQRFLQYSSKALSNEGVLLRANKLSLVLHIFYFILN